MKKLYLAISLHGHIDLGDLPVRYISGKRIAQQLAFMATLIKVRSPC